VFSNVNGIETGEGLNGNIEFWPNNYGSHNAASIPGADDKKYDFGDGMGEPKDGYGCMQVHNAAAKQTLFAINHWVNGGNADLGIGNNAGGNPDWTFSSNAGQFRTKRLRVFVHSK
jgi:sialate O-acetylesterase